MRWPDYPIVASLCCNKRPECPDSCDCGKPHITRCKGGGESCSWWHHCIYLISNQLVRCDIIEIEKENGNKMNKRQRLRIFIGNLIRRFGRWVCGPYWACSTCGTIKLREEEVNCWSCSTGEMIYHGDI